MQQLELHVPIKLTDFPRVLINMSQSQRSSNQALLALQTSLNSFEFIEFELHFGLNFISG